MRTDAVELRTIKETLPCVVLLAEVAYFGCVWKTFARDCKPESLRENRSDAVNSRILRAFLLPIGDVLVHIFLTQAPRVKFAEVFAATFEEAGVLHIQLVSQLVVSFERINQ